MSGFHNPVPTHFRRGAVKELPRLLAGRSCILLTTPGMERRGVVEQIKSLCGDAIVSVCMVMPNPTVESVTAAADRLKTISARTLLAMGGGSVLDTAKALAAQRHPNLPPGWLSLHLRKDNPFPDAFSPGHVIAVPTTAGTGSEVTMWATLWDERTGKKYSLSHPALYPEAAVVDPELTLTTPEETTVAAALDALSHAMEAVWNKNANPVSDSLASCAISAVLSNLKDILTSPSEIRVREKLHYASMLAGMAFSNTRTAIAHSISYPLTGQLGVPHGIACSFTLPQILKLNGEGAKERIVPIVRAIGCRSLSGTIALLQDFLVRVGVPKYLKRYFASSAEVDTFKGDYITPGRADNNIVPVTQSEALELFRSAAKNMISC
jgi:alcohol dehydrogenase